MRDVAVIGQQPNLLVSTLPLSVDRLLIIATLGYDESAQSLGPGALSNGSDLASGGCARPATPRQR